jgi:hypothetical protein
MPLQAFAGIPNNLNRDPYAGKIVRKAGQKGENSNAVE